MKGQIKIKEEKGIGDIVKRKERENIITGKVVNIPLHRILPYHWILTQTEREMQLENTNYHITTRWTFPTSSNTKGRED